LVGARGKCGSLDIVLNGADRFDILRRRQAPVRTDGAIVSGCHLNAGRLGWFHHHVATSLTRGKRWQPPASLQLSKPSSQQHDGALGEHYIGPFGFVAFSEWAQGRFPQLHEIAERMPDAYDAPGGGLL